MYIPNKPVKYGLKLVMAYDVQSKYMLNVIPYLGKSVDTASIVVVGNLFRFCFLNTKKLNDRIKTTSEKGMQVTKRIDVKHTQIFKDYIKKIVERGMVTAPDKNIKQKN